MVWHFWHADEDYGRRVAEGAGIDLEKAKALPPLPGRAAPGKRLQAETYTDGSRPIRSLPSKANRHPRAVHPPEGRAPA